jgi:hypothetical protein
MIDKLQNISKTISISLTAKLTPIYSGEIIQGLLPYKYGDIIQALMNEISYCSYCTCIDERSNRHLDTDTVI